MDTTLVLCGLMVLIVTIIYIVLMYVLYIYKEKTLNHVNEPQSDSHN